MSINRFFLVDRSCEIPTWLFYSTSCGNIGLGLRSIMWDSELFWILLDWTGWSMNCLVSTTSYNGMMLWDIIFIHKMIRWNKMFTFSRLLEISNFWCSHGCNDIWTCFATVSEACFRTFTIEDFSLIKFKFVLMFFRMISCLCGGCHASREPCLSPSQFWLNHFMMGTSFFKFTHLLFPSIVTT
jgi:hypothetical protein